MKVSDIDLNLEIEKIHQTLEKQTAILQQRNC